MFSLDIPTEARWIDLPDGVRVLVKPLDGIVITAARNHAVTMIRKLADKRAELEAANVPTDSVPDVSDEALRVAMIEFEFARGLARYGIINFEGVGDQNGDALPFTRARAEALAVHPAMMESFVAAYLEPQARVSAEGNASATAPGGSTGAVENTAPVAEKTAAEPARPT